MLNPKCKRRKIAARSCTVIAPTIANNPKYKSKVLQSTLDQLPVSDMVHLLSDKMLRSFAQSQSKELKSFVCSQLNQFSSVIESNHKRLHLKVVRQLQEKEDSDACNLEKIRRLATQHMIYRIPMKLENKKYANGKVGSSIRHNISIHLNTIYTHVKSVTKSKNITCVGIDHTHRRKVLMMSFNSCPGLHPNVSLRRAPNDPEWLISPLLGRPACSTLAVSITDLQFNWDMFAVCCEHTDEMAASLIVSYLV